MIPYTKLLSPLPTLNDVSSVPSAFNLAIRDLALPETCEKIPMMTIFPSGCISNSSTREFGHTQGLNEVSSVPSAFNLAILFLVVQLYCVKIPDTIIFPFCRTFTHFTVLLNHEPTFDINAVSTVPSALSLTILDAGVPSIVVNVHHTTILPSAWISTHSPVRVPKPVPVLDKNHVSKLQSVFNLAILFTIVPLNCKNCPTTTTLSSACIARLLTLVLNPVPVGTNEVSRAPTFVILATFPRTCPPNAENTHPVTYLPVESFCTVVTALL